MKIQKRIALLLCAVMAFAGTVYAAEKDLAAMTPEEITASLTLEEKAAQMVQPAVYMLPEGAMKTVDYGSILSKSRSLTASEWRTLVDTYQKRAIASPAGIPFLYGQDDVHGVGYALDTVIFPHNIGLGAANDPALMYKIGLITAEEAKLCHMLWNFAPVVAQSADPRWGRTYESYGADLGIITSLSTAYTRGLVEGGVIACPKHFFGDGNVLYGTGECSDTARLIDRGNAVLDDDEIAALLAVYQAQIDAGAQTVMISHSALNGVKMHENGTYIRYLKEKMGFDGFIVSDWNSVQNTSPSTYRLQVITAVNAGIDMLMEPERFEEARQIIIEAVQDGAIPAGRVDDAVTGIIRVKKNAGLFDDPLCLEMKTAQAKTGSPEYRAVAEKAVEEILVLLKNEQQLLPLKPGTKICVIGPAADNDAAQCGGWTVDWNESYLDDIPGVTSVKEGFRERAKQYGITVLPDRKIKEADVIVLCVGEKSYAEWNGDTSDPSLCGALGLRENEKAIRKAAESGKPVVTCIVAGRQVIIEPYEEQWDSIVMCYLPGSEGQGIADVLCGGSSFTGRLPSPWYGSADEIGTGNCRYPIGYGLTY